MMQRLTGQQLPPGMVQRAASQLMFCTDRRAGRLLWPEVSGGDMLRAVHVCVCVCTWPLDPNT